MTSERLKDLRMFSWIILSAAMQSTRYNSLQMSNPRFSLKILRGVTKFMLHAMSFLVMVLANWSIVKKTGQLWSLKIHTWVINLKVVTKRVILGIVSLEQFQQVLKNVELILVDSFYALCRKSMKFLDLRKKKSRLCFGATLWINLEKVS